MKDRRRKRILMFGYLPPPVFGPSVAYQNLLRSEFARHFDVTFINLSVVRSIRELEKFKLSKLFRLVTFATRELFYLLARRFDFCCHPIAFNRNAFLKDAALVWMARLFRVPAVLFIHGTGLARFRETLSPRLKKLLDSTIKNAEAVIVIAETLRSDFEGLVPPEKIFVVTIGIEPQQMPERSAQPEEGIRILYLGALFRAKGVLDLLRAMPIVKRGSPEAKLLMAGDWFAPEDEAEAKSVIQQNNLDSAVDFVGVLDGDAKRTFLQSGEIFVFPVHARTEAFGIVMLEAMQAGLPIVATRGGAREEVLVDGVNALLAREQDPADLAEKILKLAADPALREEMSRANRKKFENFYTHEHYGRRMIEVFERLRP